MLVLFFKVFEILRLDSNLEWVKKMNSLLAVVSSRQQVSQCGELAIYPQLC